MLFKLSFCHLQKKCSLAFGSNKFNFSARSAPAEVSVRLGPWMPGSTATLARTRAALGEEAGGGGERGKEG